MEDKLSTTSRDVLVQLVKLAQKSGMKGDKGDWKEFLTVFDKKFGASMSDPAKRTADELRAFLLTFKEHKDINYFVKIMKSNSNREQVKQLLKSEDVGSPEQKLVLLTLDHPLYSMAYSFPSHEEDWFVTKLGKKAKGKPSNTLLAVDCEMVLCEDGSEALVKICVVDRSLQVKLHEFVNPNKPVADYRTQITGVSAKDLDGVTCSVKDIQTSFRKLLARGEILVGHSLSNDLKAMKVDHATVIDTSLIFKYGDESSRRRPSLNDLCKTVLGYELRKKGAAHNCVDDACAAMKLVLAKIKHGFDNVIPVVQRDVPEGENSKLLVHRIQQDFPKEELHQVICGDFTIEIQASKKSRSDVYTAFAIFKSSQEAQNAYENLKGDEELDSSGRPQKPIPVELKSGVTSTIYVRKMTPSTQVLGKRSSAEGEGEADSKKLKTDKSAAITMEDSCVDQAKEIKRLKKLLKQRDEEISSLHKIVAALTRKQGL
ncbi:hypothetical protein RND81_11G216400 [Saponaria officinalis]|uniref:Exonuclease domain-containing protein n=1 Tax=Saponaria officinalis TaxID=3572 RepID=A0AAW1HRF3_SAPOF